MNINYYWDWGCCMYQWVTGLTQHEPRGSCWAVPLHNYACPTKFHSSQRLNVQSNSWRSVSISAHNYQTQKVTDFSFYLWLLDALLVEMGSGYLLRNVRMYVRPSVQLFSAHVLDQTIDGHLKKSWEWLERFLIHGRRATKLIPSIIRGNRFLKISFI
jgi:hypothetical protein